MRLDSRGRGNLSCRPRMEQSNPIRKLRIVRALVRPDRRAAYLDRWADYAREMRSLDTRVWLFEDESLPGRFVEFTEYTTAPGLDARHRAALDRSRFAEECVRRSGAEERYREVRVASDEPADGGSGRSGGSGRGSGSGGGGA